MSHTKIIIKNNVRIYASDYTKIAQEAINRHKTKPLASLALSTAIAVFGPLSTMKKEGRTTALYKFNGVLKNLLVESNVEGDIRALVGNPNVETDFDKKDINQIPIRVGMGEVGTLKIVNEWNGQQFGGEVSMANGDITTDLAFYFDQSEQTRTAVVSDIKMKDAQKIERAYSMIFQLLPSSTEEDIVWIEEFIKNNKMSSMSFEEYVDKIDGLLLEVKDTRWKCTCTDEKMKNIADMIPPKEREEIILEFGFLEVTCNYCNKIFKY